MVKFAEHRSHFNSIGTYRGDWPGEERVKFEKRMYINMLESVQRRVAQTIHRFRNTPYNEKLQH